MNKILVVACSLYLLGAPSARAERTWGEQRLRGDHGIADFYLSPDVFEPRLKEEAERSVQKLSPFFSKTVSLIEKDATARKRSYELLGGRHDNSRPLLRRLGELGSSANPQVAEEARSLIERLGRIDALRRYVPFDLMEAFHAVGAHEQAATLALVVLERPRSATLTSLAPNTARALSILRQDPRSAALVSDPQLRAALANTLGNVNDALETEQHLRNEPDGLPWRSRQLSLMEALAGFRRLLVPELLRWNAVRPSAGLFSGGKTEFVAPHERAAHVTVAELPGRRTQGVKGYFRAPARVR